MIMRELIAIDDPRAFAAIQAFSSLFTAIDRAKQTLTTLKDEVDQFGLGYAIDTAQRVYDRSTGAAEIHAAAQTLNSIVDRYVRES
jgi:hypothetical protein